LHFRQQLIEIRLVLGFDAVDEHEVEGPTEPRNHVERRTLVKAHVTLELRLGDEVFCNRERVGIELDRLQNRLAPALPPHDDDRVADVRTDLQNVPGRRRAHEEAFELRHLGIGNRMAVPGREFLHPCQQRIARRSQLVEVFGLRAFEDRVGAALHLASTASRSFSAWKLAISGSMSPSRDPSMIDGRLCTVRPMRWSVTRSCGKLYVRIFSERSPLPIMPLRVADSSASRFWRSMS